MLADLVRAKDLDAAAALARGAGLTPSTTLEVMRLWKSPYTLATHAKIKRLLNM